MRRIVLGLAAMEKPITRPDAATRGRLGYPAAFWFALAANAFFFFSFQGTFPVLPRFIAEVVLNRPPENAGGQVGLATMVVALAAVCTRIPSGQLTDRLGHRRFLLLGALCFTGAPLIYAASRGMPLLLLGRAVHGLGLGIFSTAFLALATDLAPVGRRGEALGLAGASTSISFISAPLAGDWLATNWGYTLLFIFSAATAAVSVVMVALIHTPGPRSSAPPFEMSRFSDAPQGSTDEDGAEPAAGAGLWQALAQTGVRVGVLTMAALGIPFGAFITFLPLFAEERQIAGVGAVYSVYAATLLLAQPLAGRLTDRVGRRGMILPGLFITGLAASILSLDSSLIVFLLGGIVFGLGGGLVRGGVDPLVQDSVLPSMRGTAAAVQYASFDLWIGGASYLVGLLANTVGYPVAFAATGAVCMLVGGGLAMMLRGAKGEQHVADQRLSSNGD